MSELVRVGNALIPRGNTRFIARGFRDAVQSDDLVTLGQVIELIAASSGSGEFLIKGFGNTLETVEDGDYRIVTNSDNTCVMQFRDSGVWDTDNETEIMTPTA